MYRSQLINIFMVVLIVMIGFGLIMPLTPYYVAEYGGSELLVGLLVASYAAAQFVGAPLLGRLSDRVGRRPILVVSLAGTAFGFLLLGLAEPLGKGLGSLCAAEPTPAQQNGVILGIMFLSRIVSGVTGGMLTVAQAYIADITDEQSRSQGMGLLGAAFGLGFIVGPLMGGVLSQWGLAVPAFAALGLAVLNLGSVVAWLSESLTAARKAELAKKARQPLISVPAILASLSRPRLGPLLTIRLLVSLAGALFMALFTLWAKNRLGLDARITSYLIAYSGLLGILTQVGLVGPLTRRFSDARLIAWSIPVLGVGMLGWALTPNVPVLMVVMIPHAIATGLLNTAITSATSWAVLPQEMGDALGTAGSFESLSRVIAPSVGGWLLGAAGAWAPGVLGAALMAGLAPFAWRKLITRPDPPLAPAVWLEQEEPRNLAPAA